MRLQREATLSFPAGLGTWVTCAGSSAAMIGSPVLLCRQLWDPARVLQEMLRDCFSAPAELCPVNISPGAGDFLGGETRS